MRFQSLINLLSLFVITISVAGCATTAGSYDDEYSDAQSDASAPGKFELWQSSDAQWRFHVVAGNGRILLSSEGYTSRTGAINGVLSVLVNGVDPTMYETHQTASGKYNLRLRAANHEIIGFTQQYVTKSNATRAIGSCTRAVTTYLDSRQADISGARVDVFAVETGFHFNLHADNGEIVLSSETYTTEAAAWNGAFAIQDAAQLKTAFEIKQSTDERYYFTLTAQNNEIVGVSQMYKNLASAEAGIASVKALLGDMDLL